MKLSFSLLIAVILLFAAAMPAQSDATADQLTQVYEQNNAALVYVDYGVEMTFRGQTRDSSGTILGLIVSEGGLVIASDQMAGGGGGMLGNQVSISKPKNVVITLGDGDELRGEYISRDQDVGIAFIRIQNAEDRKFPFVDFSGSVTPGVGDEVVLLALLPEGFHPHVKFLVGRINSEIDKPSRYLSVDNAEFLEALGGPVFTLEGKPVGIVTFRSPNQSALESTMRGMMMGGISSLTSPFANPLILPSDRFTELLKNPPTAAGEGKGWLGITMSQALTKELAESLELDYSSGVFVGKVVEGSPADQSGLQGGDIIVKLNEEILDVETDEHLEILSRKIQQYGPEREIKLAVLRLDGDQYTEQDVSVLLAEMPQGAEEVERSENERLGLTVRDLVMDDRIGLDLEADTTGVIVHAVERAGPAGLGELRQNDIIQRVGDREVKDLAGYKTVVEEVLTGKPERVVLFVRRGNETNFINCEIDWEEEE